MDWVPEGSGVCELYAGVGVLGLNVAAKAAFVRCSDVNSFNPRSFEKSRCDRARGSLQGVGRAYLPYFFPFIHGCLWSRALWGFGRMQPYFEPIEPCSRLAVEPLSCGRLVRARLSKCWRARWQAI